jgi:protoporphyrinogen IX oxidase
MWSSARARSASEQASPLAEAMTAYAWLKTLHLVFVISWFAGLFYLPRIYVNLADVKDAATRERLLLMARKLLRFMTGLGVLAVAFGMVLWGGSGVGKSSGWMHAKLVLVLGLAVYHAYCAVLYKRFVNGSNARTHVWFRWFNEVPVLVLFAIVALAVGKPF